jgi:hypothetical protein
MLLAKQQCGISVDIDVGLCPLCRMTRHGSGRWAFISSAGTCRYVLTGSQRGSVLPACRGSAVVVCACQCQGQ